MNQYGRKPWLPTSYQWTAYSFLTAALLFVSYWQFFLAKLGIANADITGKEYSTADVITQSQTFWNKPIFDRLGLALVWAFTGFLVLYIIWVGSNMLIEAKNARTILTSYANVGHASRSVVLDTILRIFAAIGPWIWIAIAAKLILPFAYSWTGKFLLHLTSPPYWLLGVLSVGFTLVFLHVMYLLVNAMRRAF